MSSVDRLPSQHQWQQLTVLPEKQRACEEDLYFREAWADWLAVGGEDPFPALWSSAILCAKPDAVVGRRLRPMLDYVRARDFHVFGAAEFALQRHAMRELWRHDWHVYPTDPLAYCSLWYTSTPMAAFLLRWSGAADQGVPASVRLSSLKGHAIAARRRPGELRTELRAPNAVLNFVHVPDEPADLLRELGIFLDRPERRALLTCLLEGQAFDGDAQAEALVAQLERCHAEHDLQFGPSLDRLVAAGVLSRADADGLVRCVAEGKKLAWDDLLAAMYPDDSRVNRWDFIVVASELLTLEREGTSGLMPGVSPNQWQLMHPRAAAAS